MGQMLHHCGVSSTPIQAVFEEVDGDAQPQNLQRSHHSAVFEMMDADHDGKVSYAEFVQWIYGGKASGSVIQAVNAASVTEKLQGAQLSLQKEPAKLQGA